MRVETTAEGKAARHEYRGELCGKWEAPWPTTANKPGGRA